MSRVSKDSDEIHTNTPDLIRSHGYVPETHRIWTEDGYCLEVHRVRPSNLRSPADPAGKAGAEIERSKDLEISGRSSLFGFIERLIDFKSREGPSSFDSIDLESIEKCGNCSNNGKRIPVIVNHGLLSSSADWVLLGPGRALAYLLCDNGFDVWLSNSRGNAYSKRHQRYTVKDREFWDFSWHEIGYYDIPAVIDYVLERTNSTEAYYVGYSQGTTAFYVMLSERPEYNSKVRAMISLAPIAFLSNQRSPLLKLVVHFSGVMEWGSSYCNVHEWFPRNRLQARALGILVRNAPDSLTQSFLKYWFQLIAGFGSNQLEKSMLPLIFGHFPAGASAKQIVHYGQSILSGSFRKFDYGATKNLKIYGSTQPPKYNLEKVKVPVAIFYSENDFLTDPTDVKKLVEKLPNVREVRKVKYSKFNHVDYLWARDARNLLYNSILAVLRKL